MRTFGRLGWQVSEIGHGMWGMGGWGGSDDEESLEALQTSLELGCNFYDSAWAYGPYAPDKPAEGRSDKLLGELIQRNPNQKIYAASKIPPKNDLWPAPKNPSLDDIYPHDWVIARAEEIRAHTGLETINLLQFHTWDDSLIHHKELQDTIAELKDRKFCEGIGISCNTFDADNGIEAIRSGLIDSVQLVYNIFTREAEDAVFAACREHNVAVIARVPLDEGSLAGTLTPDTTFPEGDWRNTYFAPENLKPTVERIEKLREFVPPNMTMAQMALAFVLANPNVSTTIPGMRKPDRVRENLAAIDIELDPDLLETLRGFRWDRDRDAQWAN